MEIRKVYLLIIINRNLQSLIKTSTLCRIDMPCSLNEHVKKKFKNSLKSILKEFKASILTYKRETLIAYENLYIYKLPFEN